MKRVEQKLATGVHHTDESTSSAITLANTPSESASFLTEDKAHQTTNLQIWPIIGVQNAAGNVPIQLTLA